MVFNLKNFIILVTLCLAGVSNVHTQVTNIVGEDEFFFKQEKRRNINLGLDIGFTNTDEHYSKSIYSHIDNETFQVGFAVRGYFPITERLTARFCLPYIIKAGLEDKEKYPNSAEPFPGLKDYQRNNGLGDITADITYEVMAQEEWPINLITQVNAQFATGESKFHSSFDGYLPLGNGFHDFSLAGGISRQLSYKTMVFSSFGYTFRLSREFEPTIYNKGTVNNGQEYKPDGVFFVRAGIGLRFFFFGQWQVFNLESEYISVGKVESAENTTSGINEIESAYQVSRIGLKFISRRERQESTAIFLGWEKSQFDGKQSIVSEMNEDDTFLLEVTIPMAIKFLNFNF